MPQSNRFSELYHELSRVFNVQELTNLSADLGLAFDWLAGADNTQRVYALLSQLDREDRLDALVLACEKQRPLSNWRELAATIRAESPFKGLSYFDVKDASLFFGREKLTTELIERLSREHFLAVIGASGSGKSSVVRAGLTARLTTQFSDAPSTDGKKSTISSTSSQDQGEDHWIVRTITPTQAPVQTLAYALIAPGATHRAVEETAKAFYTEPSTLSKLAQSLISQSHSNARFLLIVDQFEELFTACEDTRERTAFVDNLIEAVETTTHIYVVITLRADFYDECGQFPALRKQLEQHQKFIGPMERDELRRAIEEPAYRNHWYLQEGLTETILRDIDEEPGILPLLSQALAETWLLRTGRELTLQGYAESGGVRGAIGKTADTVFNNLSPDDQIIARNIFLRLTKLGKSTAERSPDTRQRVPQSELWSLSDDETCARKVLDKLTKQRLITVSQDASEKSSPERAWAEVAHEALIRKWPLLRKWLNEDRDILRFRDQVTEQTQNWLALNCDEGALFRGARVAQARGWVQTHRDKLSADAQRFLDASISLAQREEDEREAQRQQTIEAANRVALAEADRAAQADRDNLRLRRRGWGLGVCGACGMCGFIGRFFCFSIF